MRLVFLGLAFCLAACGEEQPVTVTQQERPDVSIEARGKAEAAAKEFKELGQAHTLADAAQRTWLRAEELRKNKRFIEAEAAYNQAAQGYADATAAVRKARAEKEEQEYLAAVGVQANVLALRKQLDAIQRSLSDRVQAATGWEKEVYAQTAAYCKEKVFSQDALLAIDTQIETAKALFAGKRYAKASESFAQAHAAMAKLPAQCEEAEARLRALGLKQLAAKAAKRARQVYSTGKLPPARAARDAFDAIKSGDAKFANKEYGAAMAAYDDARKGYEKAFELAPVLLAARNEVVRTYRAAMLARKGWRDYASSEGIDPDEPSAQADAGMARGKAASEKGDFTLAAKEFRAARKLFDGLETATTSGVEDELKAKQKGPAPLPPGKYASASNRHAVRLALRWLARHQDEEGRWDSDEFMKHDPADDKCDGKGGVLYDVGVSGLALLAFLEAGYSDRGGDEAYYAINLHRGLKYLLASQDEQGVFGSRASHHFMYNHCIATKAMCLAYGRTKDPRYKTSAQEAVNWLAGARNPSLAWRYEPRGKQNDTSVTAWAVQALGAARTAGLATDPDAFDGALLWVKKMTDPEFGQIGYNMPGGSPARPKGKENKFPPEKSQSMIAAGLTIRLICGDRIDKVFKKGLELMFERPPAWNPDKGTIDMYYWYMGMRLFGHPKMAKSARQRAARRLWEKALHPAIWRHQHPNGSGARTGSWDPIGAWGGDGGRVYSTAILTLALLPADS